MPPALLEKERRLTARLAALQTQLSTAVSADTWDGRRADSLETLHAETTRDYRATREEIGFHLSPMYAEAVGDNAEAAQTRFLLRVANRRCGFRIRAAARDEQRDNEYKKTKAHGETILTQN